jgi:VanZ family protein
MVTPFMWGVVLFFLHTIPGYDLRYEEPFALLRADKVAHVVLFAAFSVSLIVAFRKQVLQLSVRRNPAKWAVAVALIYGALLELYQGRYCFLRESDPVDFVANTLGVLLGVFLFRLIYGSVYREV